MSFRISLPFRVIHGVIVESYYIHADFLQVIPAIRALPYPPTQRRFFPEAIHPKIMFFKTKGPRIRDLLIEIFQNQRSVVNICVRVCHSVCGPYTIGIATPCTATTTRAPGRPSCGFPSDKIARALQ